MRLASALSVANETQVALAETIGRVSDELGDDVGLVLVFASTEHTTGWVQVVEELETAFPNALVLGCSAQSVLAAGHEAEDGPGLGLLAARLPGVDVAPGPTIPSPTSARRRWQTPIRRG